MSSVTTTVERKIPVHIHYGNNRSVPIELDVLPNVGDPIEISFSSYQRSFFTVESIVHEVYIRDDGNFATINIYTKEVE